MAGVDKIGNIFDINSTTTGVQFTPVVTALHNGGFVVAWDSNSDIAAQIFDKDNFRSGSEFSVETTNHHFGTSKPLFAPDITTLSDGTFVVTWAFQYSGADIDIKARRFTEGGSGINDDFSVASSASNETSPHIAAQPGSGNYIITYTRDGVAEGTRVDFTFYDAFHNVISGPGPIDAAAPGAAENRNDVTFLVNGAAVVAFEQGGDVYQRQLINGFNAAQVNDPGFVGDRPSIAALDNGGYVVVWREGGNINDSARPFVEVQRYDEFGNKVGSPFNPYVNAGQAVDQTTPVVIGLTGGDFMVVWDDANFGLRAVTYHPSGSGFIAVGDTIQLTPQGAGGALGNIGITQKQNGDVVVVWGGSDGFDNAGIQGQVLRPFHIVNGTNGNDAFATALSGAVSHMNAGFQASDWIRGFGGNDYLQGFGGAQDILDGGDGSDTATYIDASSPVTADLMIPAFNNRRRAG